MSLSDELCCDLHFLQSVYVAGAYSISAASAALTKQQASTEHNVSENGFAPAV